MIFGCLECSWICDVKFGVFSEFFNNYQALTIDQHSVFSRAALTTATMAQHFMSTFDSAKTGHLDPTALYAQLKILLAPPLTDAQIAQIVEDVTSLADITKDHQVGVTEYVQFMTQHETGLHLLVSKYGDQEGNLLKANTYQTELMERRPELHKLVLSAGVPDSESAFPVTVTDEIQRQSTPGDPRTAGEGGPDIQVRQGSRGRTCCVSEPEAASPELTPQSASYARTHNKAQA